jgi:hypothetical protein
MIGDAGGRKDLLAAHLPLAGERHRRNAHADCIRRTVSRVLDRSPDRLDVVALDGGIGRDGHRKGEKRRNARVARHPRVFQRQRDASQRTADQPAARRRRATRRDCG